MLRVVPLYSFSFALFFPLQCEVSGPRAKERDNVSTSDHPVPDEEERNGLSTSEPQRWADRLLLTVFTLQTNQVISQIFSDITLHTVTCW